MHVFVCLLQLLATPESGNVLHLNGGFMYVHNAKPDGPITWVFKQVAMGTFRYVICVGVGVHGVCVCGCGCV